MTPIKAESMVIEKFYDPKRKDERINKAIWKDCPKCYITIRKTKKFCSNCGFRLTM
ncbi:MAG: zinc-ribbon domain-containing protein [Candidatus Hodarchaeales archaeon]